MEDFVLRGDAAAALQASLADAPKASQKKRRRQVTIHHGEKVVSEERVQFLKEELDDAKTDANRLSVVAVLETVFISLEMLEKTRIGVALTRVSRRTESDEVKDRATKLLRVWKSRAKRAMRRRSRRVETYGRNFAE